MQPRSVETVPGEAMWRDARGSTRVVEGDGCTILSRPSGGSMRSLALHAARRAAFRSLALASLLVALAACGDDDGGMIIDVDAGIDAFVEDASVDVDANVDARVTCTSDVECNDGLFCNGRETCAPASMMADALGCIPGDAPCAATETCDEPANDCRTICEDLDGDGYESVACGGDDCDDADATRYPGATEVCDGNDEDCNDATFGFVDADMDGAGSAVCCNGTTCGTDCDDANASVRPGVADGPTMNCNTVDDDCDGIPDIGCPCSDGERRPCYGGPAGTRGIGLCTDGISICAGGVLGAECLEDVLPADEFCNDRDDDCDGLVDDGVRPRFYRDDDGDNFGQTSVFIDDQCSPPAGFAAGANDCDDTNPGRFPGADDICNLIDDDCDGTDDENAPPVTYYRDADGDGFGNPTTQLLVCGAPAGYVAAGGDCDDTRPFVSPVGVEQCDASATPLDEDCDGSVNEDCACADGETRACGGGSPVQGACRAGVQRCIAGAWAGCSGNIDPGTLTETCNGLDDDCDGMTDETLLAASCYLDADSDGYGSGAVITTLCADPARTDVGRCPSGYTSVGGTPATSDCNDANGIVRPGGTEACNGADDDCDGTIDEGVTRTYYRDADGDGFGLLSMSVTGCAAPAGYVATSTDCDDTRASSSPVGVEVCDAAVRDEDCDATANEGCACTEGATQACGGGSPVVGVCRAGVQRCIGGVWAPCEGNVDPGSRTETCNGTDDDCDGMTDESLLATSCYLDADSDGYGTGAVLTNLCADTARAGVGNCPSGYTNRGGTPTTTDCNDANGAIRPLASEVCNTIDDDCDGMIDEGATTSYFRDADGDGFGAGTATNACAAPTGFVTNATDCDDTRSSVSPSGTEICDAALRDEDCDSTANEGCACTDGASRACGGGSPVRGACRAGTQVCIAGAWASCSGNIDPGTLTESCNGLDDDCDGMTDESLLATSCYVDADSDGYGSGTALTNLCADSARSSVGNCPSGYTNVGSTAATRDCNDANAAIRPMGAEVCNTIDDDCDGMTDEGATTSYYRDADGDGFGAGTATIACAAPTGFVTSATDCDDTRASSSPAGVEVCDTAMRDENCAGGANEGCTCVDGTSRACGGGSPIRGVCRAGTQLCVTGLWGTCSGNIDPGAVTETCNGLDDDCDGMTDESLLAASCYVDADSDGFGAGSAITTLCRDGARMAVGFCPSGYTNVAGDCNDSNGGTRPTGTEVCNGTDDDCDGMTDEGVSTSYYRDADGDGFGAGTAIAGCTAPTGYVANGTDCDDTRSSVSPAAAEVCDAAMRDDDCDGMPNEMCACVDGTSRACGGGTPIRGACRAGTQLCIAGTYATCTGSIEPGTITETCNGVDDDCDGMTDESLLAASCYVDADSDGFGSGTVITTLCRDAARGSAGFCPSGYSNVAGDCNDGNGTARPMATEVCNGADDDCDGMTDEAVSNSYFRDADGDGFGAGTAITGCAAPTGYVANGTDCDDTRGSVSPSGTEVCDASMRDEDCDSTANEGCACVDGTSRACGGGSTIRGICRAGTQLCIAGAWATCSGNVDPGTVAETCNGLDDDCDGSTDEMLLAASCYVDADADGAGTGPLLTNLCADASRAAFGSCPVGHTNVGGTTATRDCNDFNAAVSPTVMESCNAVDDDCDGVVDDGTTASGCFRDSDGDGFGTGTATVQCRDGARSAFGFCPVGYSNVGSDCNDGVSAIRPGATEVCDGADQDCDGIADEGATISCHGDTDNDGFGAGPAVARCADPTRTSVGSCPSGFSNVATDCNDFSSATRPGASEICNGSDDDCDGMTDEMTTVSGCYRDNDGDGYGLGAASTQCRDAARAAFGECPVGFSNVSSDCNDAVTSVRPGATELCDGVDQDCDGAIDEGATISCYGDADADGFGAGTVVARCADPARTSVGGCPSGFSNLATDCNDGNPTVRPGAVESCNSIDDDCDGSTDEGALLTCYPDGDNDGYAPAGAVAEQLCPSPGRSAVAGCALNYTNRAPTGVNIDCRDARVNINPGEPDTCNGVDDDCSGTADDNEATTECTAPNGYAGCRLGTCVTLACTPERANCDGDPSNGCEVDLNNNDEHCGACGDRCPGGCVNGLCRPMLRVVRGTDHVCALRDTGRVACWGSNSEGQLGDGSTTQRLVPVAVQGLNDAVDLAAGEEFTCAVRATGAVVCWGTSALGQLGVAYTPTTPRSTTPSVVPGVSDATQVDAGRYHACARSSTGVVTCWGGNSSGQAGRTPSTSVLPGVITGVNAAEVRTSDSASCARTNTNDVVCWGGNSRRERGDSDTAARATPGAVVLTGASELDMGPYGGCALVGGIPNCWGAAYVNGRTTDNPAPAAIAGATGVDTLALDNTAGCARTSTGERLCWGSRSTGIFGDGGSTVGIVLTAFPVASPSMIEDLAAGGGGMCAVRTGGSVFCWGDGDSGQLGIGEFATAVTSPVRVQDVLDLVQVEVFNGDTLSWGHRICARRHDGRVYCWGLGRWTSGGAATDTQLTPLFMHANALDVAAGGDHVCVRNELDRVRCWGGNSQYQLGDGTTTNRYTFATLSTLNNIVGLDASSRHTCAVDTAGQVYCWGSSGNAQSGLGTGNAMTPNAVTGATTAVDISTGFSHSCATLRDGRISCWGERYTNGRTTRNSVPFAVPGDDFVASTGGYQTACGQTFDGRARCWGSNASGQFGIGATSGDTVSPTTVSTLTAIRELDTSETSCAIEGNASDLYCWGANNRGQVGIGSTTITNAPRAVGLSGVTHVSNGATTTCAIQADGLYCWGEGPLGDGTTASSTTPVEIVGNLYDP
jgi:alpha-tubulin suppressor-like RCC1 family protein